MLSFLVLLILISLSIQDPSMPSSSLSIVCTGTGQVNHKMFQSKPHGSHSTWRLTNSSVYCNSPSTDPTIYAVVCKTTLTDPCYPCGENTGRQDKALFIIPKDYPIPGWMSSYNTIPQDTEGMESLSRLSLCTLSTDDSDALKSFSKTSVLFVSISFIILMVISLAWLVFYYVQRFRYAHAKDRLQRRLFNAAKKALTRMPTKTVKTGDVEGDCAICIDPYLNGDIVRILPCKHVYHKTCIDPWLLDHRTCPMCKVDILKAYGFQVSGESRREEEREVIERREVRRISPEPLSIHEDRVRVVSQVHLPPSNSAVFIDRSRPTREHSWTGSVSTRPSSSSHIVNLVHVRSRSASCAPRAATFRSYPHNNVVPLPHSSSSPPPPPSSSSSPPSSPSIDHTIQLVQASVHSEGI
ncbi:hypothetical protein PRIPAC_92780 [Pristionchus pacificus]|uniref:Zinc finger protein n=1 Tax=Pristionchus pacificus TaxID=54126 RepID=A0A2A6CQJ1_PRIPA|nr:hypothetical protein PRIPAC_92780 [Pristionchus pacificus]|eukprot:PDM80482.1 zinc finger protein [Pristionchus pacificus]